MAMLELAQEHQIQIIERPFTASHYKAREAFLTSATTFIMPIVEADGHQIADGRPGPMTQKLQLFINMARHIGLKHNAFNAAGLLVRCQPVLFCLINSFVSIK